VDPDDLGLFLQGDICDCNFSLLQNDRVLGRIQKAVLSWGDTSELTIRIEVIITSHHIFGFTRTRFGV